MSVFSDGSLDITTEGLQERLERGISPESRATIEKILASVNRLSNVEKLFLYLRLPTHVPVANTATQCTKTSSDTESLAVTWMKTHLTRNAKTSLLRQKVYDDYRMFCEAHRQEPVSVSDFKKILLSVFPELTTRRLGSRGNAKHMFGGISYLMQPNSFTVPKIKVEEDNQEAFCDDTVACTKDRSEGRGEDRVNRAASRLILEWAYKLLSIPFESIQDLALHLISKSYVSQVSEEAFAVTAGTNCEVNYKDSLEEIPIEDTTQKQLHTRHQLQRKLQERREITRQKQRMEEERSHLATQESVHGAPSAKQTPTSLAQAPRNPLPGVSRTPGPKFNTDAERNPRRPSVPTILPKTLLPKLVVGGPRLDLDPRVQRRVDQPQFILLSPNASQLQPGHTAGSLVFISSTLAQTVPAAEAKLPIQAVVKNVGVAQAGRRPAIVPAWIDLPCSTSDLTVVSASSVAAPVPAEGCYNNQTRPLETSGGISQVFPGSTEKNAKSIGAVCSVVNGYVRPIFLDVVAGGRQGNQFGNCFAADSGDVQRPAISQEVQSLALAAVGRSSALSVQDLTMPLTSVSTELFTGKDSSLTSLASNSSGFLDDGNLFGIDYRHTLASGDNNAPQNSGSPISFQPELQTQPEQQSPYGANVKQATRTTNPLSQGSKGRGRNVPSRSSTKTVSSILDEQRCSSLGGSRAMKFYNDSRSVSQILKELREKSISSESEQGTGVSAVLDLDQNAAPNPFVGIVPPNFQIVQVLPPCSAFKSTDKIVQSTSAVQLPGTRSSTSLDLQAAQPVNSSKVQGMPMDGDLQSPVRRRPPGLLSEVLLSSKSVVQLIQPTELALPHLIVPTPATSKTERIFDPQQTASSIFSFIDPVVSHTIGKSRSSLSKHTSSSVPLCTVNPEWGGKKSASETKCGNFLHVTVSTSGVETGDSVGKSFVSQGILHADSGMPSTLVERFKFVGFPVVMSTSESQSAVQSSCVNLQQFFLKPVETASVTRTFSENCALPTQRGYSFSLAEDKGTKLGQVNVGRSTDNNQARSSVKRSVAAENYCGIKKLLLGDDRPKELVDRPLVKLEYFAGETGGMETGKAIADSILNRLHSPGDEINPMPYKDNYVQHCTLQQLSQVSNFRMLQQARLRQQVESQSKQGSRPASAYGNDKTGLGLQGTWPSRPNTVAGDVLDGTNPETDYLDASYEQSAEGSRGSERSTPMSGLSPRSNLSSCSLYLDQSNAFMPIHITDSLPSVTAIKPLPTLGQRHRLEMEGFGISRPADARNLAAAFTADARSFVPYTSSESPRVMMSSVTSSRSGGFAPASSIRPLKKGGQSGAASRQRHHSAHDFQNSCNKIPQGIRLQEVYEASSLQQCLPPAPISMPEPSAFGGVVSSGLGLLPGAMMPPVFDFQDLETAGEVEEIIAASHESSVGGAALTALQRSQSEPANCLQANCTFDLDKMIHEMLNDAVTDSSATEGSNENLSSHGSQVDWSDCSDKCQAPVEKLGDARDPSDTGEELPWSTSSRDRLISGVELQPSLAFSDGLHCGDLNSSEFGAFEHSARAFIDEGCTPPLSQNSSPEFTSEMPLFDKPDKELEAFPPDGGQSTALDTPNSLEGLFGAICGDDNENHGQSTSCNMDFNWPY